MNNYIVISVGISLYMIFIGILYYVIFHKHHKRNNVTLDELVHLVPNFYGTCFAVTCGIAIGFYAIFSANEFKDERSYVIGRIVLGILIISYFVYYFVNYCKNNLRDYDKTEREITRKNIKRIGEILEFILFTIFIFMPLWQIPYFLEIFTDKMTLYKEVVKSFVLSLCSIMLMYNINPIGIIDSIKKIEK